MSIHPGPALSSISGRGWFQFYDGPHTWTRRSPPGLPLAMRLPSWPGRRPEEADGPPRCPAARRLTGHAPRPNQACASGRAFKHSGRSRNRFFMESAIARGVAALIGGSTLMGFFNLRLPWF